MLSFVVECQLKTMLIEGGGGQNRVTHCDNVSTTEQGSTVSIKQYIPNLAMHSPETNRQSPTVLSYLQDEKSKGPKRKYLEQWVHDVSDQASLHGLIWYTRIQNIWVNRSCPAYSRHPNITSIGNLLCDFYSRHHCYKCTLWSLG